uniref:Glucosidase II subunit alpha n=1 Tax=Hirondellea gigas TaxID=1518452 RepID=A0A6A7G7H0_9CRUS
MRALFVILIGFTFLASVRTVDQSKFRTCAETAFCGRHRNQSPEDLVAYHEIKSDSVKVVSDHKLTADLILRDDRYAVFDVPQPVPLVLEATLLVNDVVRLRILERDPLYPRYEVSGVLESSGLRPFPHVNDGAASGFKFSASVDRRIRTKFGENSEYELVLHTSPDPFRADLYINNELAVSVNSENLLKFETYRVRPSSSADSNAETSAIDLEEDNSDGVDADVECELDSLGQCVDETIAGDNSGEDPEASKEVVQKVFPEDSPGMWEEKFGTHTDTKKYGPSSFGMDISFVGSKDVYGIPEHASTFSLKTTKGENSGYNEPYRLYNLDVFEYDLDIPMALYGSIPYLVSHDSSKSVGVLWLNSAETFVDISDTEFKTDSGPISSKTSHWISESGIIDLFILSGSTPSKVSLQYATLTGFPTLPPKFAISYHQCRWNYRDEADVEEVDAKFEEHDIPYDVLWLDIEHTDGKKYLTWDSHKFPNPQVMQEKLAVKSRKMVIIVDPHIKKDSSYFVHSDGISKDLFVKNSEGKVYEGWCWPGTVNYLDFFSQKVVDYWADLFQFDKHSGSTPSLFVWNDMNEPSVFNGPEVTMPKDCVHIDKWEHRDVHNLYGMEVHSATYEGLLRRSNNEVRPFVLSRSFFVGSQKFGAIWTGDNKAEWSHLKATTPMLLSHSIAGLPFVGADVGGFFGNPDAELLLRWYQMAAYQPFFRGHAHIDTKRREPWVFGDPWTERIRDAIRSRYIHLPYFYTLFYQSSQDGKPIMRPLWYEYPSDERTFQIEDQFLLGSDLLIKPITEAGMTMTTVYLPGKTSHWIDMHSFARFQGGKDHVIGAPIDQIPVFQRAGSVIPRKERFRRSSGLMKDDPYTLFIILDSEGNSSGELFEDDGFSFQFSKGNFVHRKFSFRSNVLSSISLNRNKSLFQSSTFIERIVIIGYEGTLQTITRSDSNVPIEWKLDREMDSIIVKKPNLRISDDFALEFS